MTRIPSLFVDCDDTLILYRHSDTYPTYHPYGLWHGMSWYPNKKLITGIIRYQFNNPQASIFIWSGGGAQYACECAEKVGLTGRLGFLIKDVTTFYLIQPGDIVIDDDNIDGIRTHTPFTWPEEDKIEDNLMIRKQRVDLFARQA